MSPALRTGGGGTFCRFTIGAGVRGASARYLHYIANSQAVREGKEGVWLKEFPDVLERASYPVMVETLLQYARRCEQREFIIGHKNNQKIRTHYTAMLSFETAVSTAQAKEMLALWMKEVFPRAEAAGFLHRNTQHVHLHVWIAARQTDGKKINLSARAFRQLDETWNRIYSHALHRDEQEHLLKKGETERWKELRREEKGEGIQKPVRVAHDWNPIEFNEREQERLGGKTKDNTRQEDYDVNETRVGGDQRGVATGAGEGEGRTPHADARDPAVEAAFRQEQKTVGEAQRAISELARLYRDVERVDGLARTRAPDPEIEREG